jgi:hypothetical protein
LSSFLGSVSSLYCDGSYLCAEVYLICQRTSLYPFEDLQMWSTANFVSQNFDGLEYVRVPPGPGEEGLLGSMSPHFYLLDTTRFTNS